MKKIIIKSNRIILRSLKLSDVNNNYLEWFKNPETKKFVIYSPKNDLKVLRKDVNEFIKKKDEIFLGIFTLKNRHIGNVRLYDINKKKCTSGFGILIGDQSWRGKGVASEAIELCGNYLYKKFKISKILLGTKLKNKKAINLYKNSGFVFYKKTKKNIFFYRDYFKCKIAIGTAQLGSKYGIANKSGKIKKNEMKKIICAASNNGMNLIETAHSYGSSEKILGSIKISGMNVVTKLPTTNPQNKINEWMLSTVKNSIKNLRVKRLHGLLVHKSSQLNGKVGIKIYKSLLEMKKKKLINKIGVAVYTVRELRNLISKFKFDIVSIPFNIFDQRFKNSGQIKKLKKLDVEVYVRSVFLQGLLLMNKQERPNIFQKWKNMFYKWDAFVKKSGKSRAENCLGFVLNHSEIDKIILGFDNYKHFKNISKKVRPLNISPIISMERHTSNLLDPTKWTRI